MGGLAFRWTGARIPSHERAQERDAGVPPLDARAPPLHAGVPPVDVSDRVTRTNEKGAPPLGDAPLSQPLSLTIPYYVTLLLAHRQPSSPPAVVDVWTNAVVQRQVLEHLPAPLAV